MAFVLPTFNLECQIYTFPYEVGEQPRLTVKCQLRAPNSGSPIYTSGLFAVTHGMMLLLPPGTDIRDGYSTPGNSSDYVRVPLGNSGLYSVLFVNDIGKGFPNEHRYAIISKVITPNYWPVPQP